VLAGRSRPFEAVEHAASLTRPWIRDQCKTYEVKSQERTGYSGEGRDNGKEVSVSLSHRSSVWREGTSNKPHGVEARSG